MSGRGAGAEVPGLRPRSPAAHALGVEKGEGDGARGAMELFWHPSSCRSFAGWVRAKKEPQVWWWGDGLEAPFLALGGGGEEG